MCNHHIYLLTNEYMRNMICAISFGDQSSIINKLRKIYQRRDLDIISRNSRICPTVQHFGTYICLQYTKTKMYSKQIILVRYYFMLII